MKKTASVSPPTDKMIIIKGYTNHTIELHGVQVTIRNCGPAKVFLTVEGTPLKYTPD